MSTNWYFKQLPITTAQIICDALHPALALIGLVLRLIPVTIFLAICYGSVLALPPSDPTLYSVPEVTAVCFIMVTVGFILGALYERLHVLMFLGTKTKEIYVAIVD